MTLNKSVARETVNVEVSPVKPKYGIHLMSEEAKVIKPASKHTKKDLQTDLTKCKNINTRLGIEISQYSKVAEVFFGLFKQMSEEITLNVSTLVEHSRYTHV